MEHGGNIRVTDAGCRPGLAQKTKPRRFITEIALADDFQRHGASQIDVEGFVSDPHRTATQLDRFPVLGHHQSVMLKSLFRLFGYRVHRNLRSRRLAGLNAASEPVAEHAHRTKFRRSRKFVAAARAGALGLLAHGANRPSKAIEASQRAWISCSACSG